MTKIPDAQTLLMECLGALNWVPNQELPEGSNYGDTYALATHVAMRLNIMRDMQSRKASDEKLSLSTGQSRDEPDPEIYDLLWELVRSGGPGLRADPWNVDVRVPVDIWDKVRAWVKEHEPKPKLTAEEVLREVYEQAQRYPLKHPKTGLSEAAWSLVEVWAKQNDIKLE